MDDGTLMDLKKGGKWRMQIFGIWPGLDQRVWSEFRQVFLSAFDQAFEE
jgi:hypothetical protein